MSEQRKSKRKCGTTTGEEMAEALNLVINDGLSIRKVSIATGISYATLWRYVDKKKKAPESETIRLVPNYYSRLVFTEDQEKILAQNLRNCCNMAYGVENEGARKLAFQFAAKINVKVPEGWVKHQMAGKHWMRSFLERQKMKVQNKEERTFFNNYNADVFFNNFQQILRANPSLKDGYHIYNLSEITFGTVSNVSVPKSGYGTKKSLEQGHVVTICMIVSAAGNFLPPAIIFPKVSYNSDLVKGAPCRTLGLSNPTGSMTDLEFLKVIDHFITFTSSTKENPTILVFQHNKSSISLKILEKAQAAGVILSSLPPNSNNLMHPLNISVHDPFKAYYKEACKAWQKNNSGQMTINDISPCIAEAFYKAFTPLNILWGFKSSGIFSCNPHILKEDFKSNDEEGSESDKKESESDEECRELKEGVSVAGCFAEDADLIKN